MPSIIAEGSGELRVARTPPAPATRFPVLPEQKEPRSRMVFPDHIGKLLDAEGGDKLHSCAVAHAKDAPARRLHCAYVALALPCASVVMLASVASAGKGCTRPC
jgi:hypothetical protein